MKAPSVMGDIQAVWVCAAVCGVEPGQPQKTPPPRVTIAPRARARILPLIHTSSSTRRLICRSADSISVWQSVATFKWSAG